MKRIVYCLYSHGGLNGGHKIILRHVEALRSLGFNAVANTGPQHKAPWWFEHRAPILVDEPLSLTENVIVLPEDAGPPFEMVAGRQARLVVLAQSRIELATTGFAALDLFGDGPFPAVMAVSEGIAGLVRRAYPAAAVEVVPAFADERVFKPGRERQAAIACLPRKRHLEGAAIQSLFRRFHPKWRSLFWNPIDQATEAEVARVMGSSSLFLSLSRLEGLGLTPLEAMACGCVVAGFTGIGGREFATPQNGFWVEEDDCESAAEALAEAAELVQAGGPALAGRLEAGFETARAWSYAAFKARLEEVWMRLAPEARLKDGPLD